MKFDLVFDRSGDVLPFEVKYNYQLLQHFVDHANNSEQNSFAVDELVQKEIDQKLTHLHWAICKVNEILSDLIGVTIDQHSNLEQYLDQNLLNKIHCDWALSQTRSVDIDQLRHSAKSSQAKLGNVLHDCYPDHIRHPMIAPVLEKLGYIYAYEEVNMAVHRLEHLFTNKMLLEFKAQDKWKVFDNPCLDSFVTNNDLVNFSFGYTYVGRQLYNKFRFFDSQLQYQDHYNYETLELAFQMSLARPETVPFSAEAQAWAEQQGVKLVAEQIPIGNLIDLDQNLFEYRKIIYRNSRDKNKAKIILH